MTSAQIRQSFLDFFREKQHTIVPSSLLLPDAPNLLFTNAGMNQFVPIFLGQQKPPWNPPRVADTQKCIRAGGKHNDLEDVGLDTYHHTFFEMLGNWSFGDYFKKEAIEWAWELVVERWNFPPQRLYATVYKPGPNEQSEFDQEAHDHWARLFRDADLDPAIHVVSGGKADNFWMMGDTGPCGPCSELHVDLTPDGDTRGALVNKNDPRCIEIWNLVFIQFNANPVAGVGDPGQVDYVPLAQRHVDTGMGFERATAIIQGTKNLTDFSGTISNYQTDIFRSIFDDLEKLSRKKYASTLPEKSPQLSTLNSQQAVDIAFRVIADHIRALSFAIADGIIPSNEGRGYVLRRILRRAVRYGRSLGFHEPFFFKLVDVVAKTMGEVFPEVRVKQQTIKETIRREEESFNKTVDAGIEQFEKLVDKVRRSSDDALLERLTIRRTLLNKYRCQGLENRQVIAQEKLPELVAVKPTTREDVFRILGKNPNLTLELEEALWRDIAHQIRIHIGEAHDYVPAETIVELFDTYGFPLDLTELMARERGLTVDVAGFERLMERQRERARKAQKKEVIQFEGTLRFHRELTVQKSTRFVGYDFLETEAVIERVLPKEGTQEVMIVLDQTPFYAEGGGQVGDRGTLHVPGHDRTEVGRLGVIDTQKRVNMFVHRATVLEGRAPELGEAVRVSVDVDRRKLIQGHHTVTHLLHWALHEVVSKDATQKGSYVGPDKLTFDFSSAALTPQQKRDVEKLVNDKVAGNAPVTWTEISYAEAKRRRDIQQFFGEKYGDAVRVVQIGGEPGALNGYSMELCGGTHVRSTGEIGPFRIVSGSAIAAGIRRIEAVAGEAARAWARQEAARQRERFQMLSRKKPGLAPLPVFSGEPETEATLATVDMRTAHLEKLEAEVLEWEKQSAKAAEAELRSRAAQIADELSGSHTGKDFCVAEVPNADAKLLQAVVDALRLKFKGPIFLASATDGNVALIASVPKTLTSKFQANKMIQQIVPIIGGKGGGRPEIAQGAGKDVSQINRALEEARRIIGRS